MKVFSYTARLNVVLRKGKGTLCLSKVPPDLKFTLSQLTSIKKAEKN